MAIPGERTKLKLDGTAVASVVSVSGPSMSVAEIETTDLDSAAKTFRPSLIPEIGTVTCTVYYDATAHQNLVDLIVTPSSQDWQIEFQDTTTIDFTGFLTGLNITGGDVDSNIQAEITIRIDDELGTVTPPTP